MRLTRASHPNDRITIARCPFFHVLRVCMYISFKTLKSEGKFVCVRQESFQYAML